MIETDWDRHVRQKPLWNSFQVAKYLGLTWGSIHKLKERHGLPFIKIDGQVRFYPAAIKKWVAQRQQSNPVRCRCGEKARLRKK